MKMETTLLNALSIDVEDYFHVSAFEHVISMREWPTFESRVQRNVEHILHMLDESEVRATFFVLGWVAERFPALVRRIGQCGHEIACHGYAHQLVYRQDPQMFRNDVRQCLHHLEDIVGTKIDGYRAPSYSIVEQSRWALDILVEEGFRYDSSIFPIHHDRYGIPGAERWPHIIDCQGTSLIEFPLSTVRWGRWTLPVSGGGYFRLLPYWYTHWGLTRLNAEGCPAIFYLHPWEFDPQQPRIRAGWRSQWRHYTNLRKTEDRFRTLLREFRFAPVQEVLQTFFASREAI